MSSFLKLSPRPDLSPDPWAPQGAQAKGLWGLSLQTASTCVQHHSGCARGLSGHKYKDSYTHYTLFNLIISSIRIFVYVLYVVLCSEKGLQPTLQPCVRLVTLLRLVMLLSLKRGLANATWTRLIWWRCSNADTSTLQTGFVDFVSVSICWCLFQHVFKYYTGTKPARRALNRRFIPPQKRDVYISVRFLFNFWDSLVTRSTSDTFFYSSRKQSCYFPEEWNGNEL